MTARAEFDRVALRPWFFAAAMAVVACVTLMAWNWSGGLPYDATSGVWAALADDFARGEFYRAVDGPGGFGGTRYMPGFFVLHGALIRAGASAAVAGLWLTITSQVLFLGLVFLLLRRLGCSRVIAATAAGIVTSSVAWQLLSVSIKGDLLGAGLNIGGFTLAIIAIGRGRHGWLRGAGVLLGLAVCVKFTEVFALGTLVLWFGTRREWARFRDLVVPAALTIAVGVASAYRFSDGRAAEAFAVCATGGAGLGYAAKFPYWFVRVAVQDPYFLVLFGSASVLAWRAWRRRGIELPTLYFAVTAIGTVLIFVSPGTDSNHLIGLLAASVVILATQVSAGGISAKAIQWSGWVMLVAVSVTWIPGMLSVRHFLMASGRPTMDAVQEIQRRLPPGSAVTLLAENPMVPLALGARPMVLDCFSLRLVAEKSVPAREKFFTQLRGHAYSAVVLVDWSGAPVSQRWQEIERHGSAGVEHFYGDVHFPPGFLETLKAQYRLSFVAGPFVVFEPKREPAPTSP